MEKKIAAILLLMLAAYAQSSSRATKKSPGAWSAHAVSLFNTWGALDENPGRKADFPSPDGRKLVRVRGESVSVLVEGKVSPTSIGEMTNPELMWSPNSNAFVITSTSGGELGKWEVRLFQITSSGIREVGIISGDAATDYAKRIRSRRPDRDAVFWKSAEYCDINAVAVKWVDPSRLALATLVPNSGRCRRMSDWDGYIINVPSGEIEERVASKVMRKRFGSDNVPR